MWTARAKFAFFNFLLAFIFACASSQQAKSSSEWKAALSSDKTADGTALLIRLTPPAGWSSETDPAISAEWNSKPIVFYKNKRGEQWVFEGIVGIPYDFAPSAHMVKIQIKEPALTDVEEPPTTWLEVEFEVVKGDYPAEVLFVQPQKIDPPKKYLKRIMREVKEIKAVYEKSEGRRLWSNPLVLPVQSAVTSVYGSKRVYNGRLQNYHSGVDLRAGVGTPIYSPIEGKVVMAKDLYFTGYTVILDHGLGFFTIYAHMSKLKVKKGAFVKKGQLIGLAGATGRVSGPHLHWGANIQGVKVSPMDLMKVLE